jgi:imidazolonepropionase-like amidohydrolase
MVMSKFFSLLLHVLAVVFAFVVMLGALLSIAYFHELYTPPDEEQPVLLAIAGGTLIDGSGGPPIQDATILIGADQILDIRRDGVRPRGTESLRIDGLIVIPALLDAAVYFEAPVGDEVDYLSGEWAWEVTRGLPEHRRAFLEAGVTAVQDLGSAAASILRTRSLLEGGEFAGPRLWTSGPILIAPGNPWVRERYPTRLDETTLPITTTEEGRGWVRDLGEQGMDLVSLDYRGGSQLDEDALGVLIKDAHALDLRVVVHTSSLDEARQAVSAGADALVGGVTLEGQQLDGEILASMIAGGVFYIPSLSAVEMEQDGAAVSLETALLNTWLARQAGVPVVAGSGTAGRDVQVGQSLHRELELLVAAGLTPAEALRSATFQAARLLGVERRLGTVAENKLADLVILTASPLDDIRAVGQVQMVIQNGVIVVDRLSGSATSLEP